jgi:hypothetical protein
MRLIRLRSAALLSATFLAGVAVEHASSLIGSQFERDLGFGTAFAKDSDRPTPIGCSPCLVLCSSACAPTTLMW